MARRGRLREKQGTTVRVEVLNGNQIVDELELTELEPEEGETIIETIQEMLEEKFGFEFPED